MKSPGSGSSESSAFNIGESKLIDCLSLLEIPYKYTMIQRMEDVKEEVLLIEKNGETLPFRIFHFLSSMIVAARVVLERVRVMQGFEKSLQHANEAFCLQMSGWLDHEKSSVKSLAGKAFDENESILKPAELITSTLFATTTLHRSNVSCLFSCLFSTAIMFYSSKILLEILSTLELLLPQSWNRN